MGENSPRAGPGEPVVSLTLAEPPGFRGSGRVEAMPALCKELPPRLWAERKSWNPEEEVPMSALTGASPVIEGGSRSHPRKLRGANGTAWLRARPSRLNDLHDSNQNAFATAGETSGPLTRGSALPAWHPLNKEVSLDLKLRLGPLPLETGGHQGPRANRRFEDAPAVSAPLRAKEIMTSWGLWA